MSSRRRPPASAPPLTPHKKPPARLWRALGLALLLAACAASFWYWRQYARPGASHDRQAQQDAAEGRPGDAEREWLQGIREDASYAPCYVHLGDLYMQARRFPDAVTEYNAAAKLAPGDGMLFLQLNRADLAVHDVRGAEAAAKRAADLLPDNADAAGLYGLLEVQQKNNPAALAPLRRAHHLRPSDRDYLLALVPIEIEDVAFAQAQSDLAPYLQAHPTDYWACHLMAVIFELKSHDPADWKTALAYEQRAAAGLPGDPRVYLTLGDLYLDLDRPADALSAFQTGQRLLPNSEAMWHGLVGSYSRLGEKRQAAAATLALQRLAARHQRITYLQEQMILRPADAVPGLALARLEEEDGDDGAARSILMDLLRQAPHDPRPHRALADFYQRRGRPRLAQQAARLDYMP